MPLSVFPNGICLNSEQELNFWRIDSPIVGYQIVNTFHSSFKRQTIDMNEIEVASPELPEKSAFLSRRLTSLDAYRGLIMITLAFGGFGLAKTAGNMLEGQPESTFWALIQNQFTHAQWVGCTYWDLIQPSFMFMVGLSMPYSYSKRREHGSGYFGMFIHACSRSIILVILGIFLTSNWSDSTSWSFMNVLSQIGLGYTFVFLLLNRSWITQALVAATILAKART